VPATVVQLWEPGTAQGSYRAALLGRGRARYRDARRGIEHAEEVALVAELPASGENVDWTGAQPLASPMESLLRTPPPGIAPGVAPSAVARSAAWRSWESSFKNALGDRVLTLWRSPSLDELSRPGEGERELRIRLAERAREGRAARLDAIRARWAKKAEQAANKVAKAQQAVDTQRSQLHGQELQTAISVGATVLGALFGRKRLSYSTLGRATTAARGAGRTAREAQDVSQAQQGLAAAQAEAAEVERQMTAELTASDAATQPETEALQEVRIPAREAEVDAVMLLWRRA
jgi:hypothetical protein